MREKARMRKKYEKSAPGVLYIKIGRARTIKKRDNFIKKCLKSFLNNKNTFRNQKPAVPLFVKKKSTYLP